MCTIEGCEKPVFIKKRGWCNMHYQRWRKGLDMHQPPKRSGGTLAERFASFIEIAPSDECLEWPGYRGTRDYGHFTYQNKLRKAHIVSYELHVGPISSGMVIRHKCDNPPCVNPRHLQIGMQAENVRDAVERGRWQIGETHNRAKLTESQVLEIRELAKTTPLNILAEKYSMDSSQVCRIVNRKSWRHI